MVKKKPDLYGPLKKIPPQSKRHVIACCRNMVAILSVAIQKKQGGKVVCH